MIRYKFLIIVSMVFILFNLSLSVNADAGPKPTSDIEIIGMDEPYYFDIFAEYSESTVRVLTQAEIDDAIEYEYYRDDFPDELNGYRDADGFASYTLYRGIPHYIALVDGTDNVFHCGYYAPPDTFKIVLVTESGEMIVSDIIYKQLFNAYFTFDLSDFSVEESSVSSTYNDVDIYEVPNSVNENIPVTKVSMEIVLTVVITLVIEGLLMLAFGYKTWKSYRLGLIVNLITQTIMYGLIFSGGLLWSVFAAIGLFILSEIVVIITEVFIYRKWLNEKSKIHAIGYAITANITSAVLGTILVSYIISLF